MGLIKFGGGVAAISGKISGTVFARNRSGAYARNWSKPTNPGSVLQAGVRQALSMAATSWQMLTSSQVDAWNAYAATMTRLNRLGDAYVPTGRQIYIECHRNKDLYGGSPLSVPGPTTVAPSIGAFNIVAAVATAGVFTSLTIQAASIAFPSGADPADCGVLVYAAPAHSTQKVNVNKQRRFLQSDQADQIIGAPYAIAAAWNPYFGAIAADGNMIDIWARVVDNDTGLASPFALATSLIT